MALQDMSKEQEYHTYGDSLAAEVLFQIMQSATKKESRKVGRIHQKMGSCLNRLTINDSTGRYIAKTIHIEIMSEVENLDIPRNMKTHLCNVLSTMYKKWLRAE